MCITCRHPDSGVKTVVVLCNTRVAYTPWHDLMSTKQVLECLGCLRLFPCLSGRPRDGERGYHIRGLISRRRSGDPKSFCAASGGWMHPASSTNPLLRSHLWCNALFPSFSVPSGLLDN
jgi:hypothetical protein